MLAPLEKARKNGRRTLHEVTLDQIGIRVTAGGASEGLSIGILMPNAPPREWEIGTPIHSLSVTEGPGIGEVAYRIRFAEQAGQEDPLLVHAQCEERKGLSIFLNEIDKPTVIGFRRFDQASVDAALMALKTSNSQKLVLDMRFNGGGNITEMIRLLSAFLPDGTPVGEFRSREKRTVFQTPSSKHKYKGKIVILISEFTGSAAETFAHSMRRHERVTLIGSTTSGDSLVSRTFSLPGGGEVQVPVGTIVMSDGAALEGFGVTPDIQLPRRAANDSYQIYNVALESLEAQ